MLVKMTSSVVVMALEAVSDITVICVEVTVGADSVLRGHTHGQDVDSIVHLEICVKDTNFQSASR